MSAKLVFAAVLSVAAPAWAASPASFPAPLAAGSRSASPSNRWQAQQERQVVSHSISVSSREAALELEFSTGRSRTVSLRGGRLMVDGQAAGRYEPGGALDRAWRRLLADGASLETPELLVALRAFRTPDLSGADSAARERIEVFGRDVAGPVRAADPGRAPVALRAAPAAAQADTAAVATGGTVTLRLSDWEQLDAIGRRLEALDEVGPEVAEAVRTSSIRVGDVTVPAGQRLEGHLVVYRGDAEVLGEVEGNVVALFGDVVVHGGGVIGGSAVAIDGAVRDEGGTVNGDSKTVSAAALTDVRARPGRPARARRALDAPPSGLERVSSDALHVVAMFAALAMLGFGAVFFGRRNLEIVADTVSHSFPRAVVVGLLGQLLLLPTFAMLMVGLVFTVIGILLLPFAAVGYAVAASVAALGGYLAVAHAVGETFTRRRMAHGAFVRAPNSYGYLFTGLVGLLGLWALAALTGWLGPLAVVFRLAALLVTWIAVTAGFGAVLLSRGGLRDTFAGRQYGELSDEYLWATPPPAPARRAEPK